MCGIAGVLLKNGVHPELGMSTGRALVEMLSALLHRGPDSAGFGLYREPLDKALRMRFFVQEGEGREADIERIRQALTGQGAEIVEEDEEDV